MQRFIKDAHERDLLMLLNFQKDCTYVLCYIKISEGIKCENQNSVILVSLY